jgi:hypothetical protein
VSEAVIQAFFRVFLTVFGIVCIVAGFHSDTTIRRRRNGGAWYPVTRGQRVVFVVFGCLFALYGVMGWLS